MAWNGSSDTNSASARAASTKPAKPSPSWLKGALAGLVIVAAGLAAVLYLMRPAEKPTAKTEEKKVGGLAEVQPANVKQGEKPVIASDQVKNGKKVSNGGKAMSRSELAGRGLSDVPEMVEMPKPENPPPLIRNASDQMLLMAINNDGNDLPPMPLGGDLESEFKMSLKQKIVINEDDTQEVKEMKQRIIDARKEMQEMLREGKTVKEVLEARADDIKYQAEVRQDALAEAKRIFKSGDIEGAKKYVTMMNVALQQIGIKKIEMPVSREERIERIQQRALEREQKELVK